MDSLKKIRMHLIPSSHWDREWYLTRREFQVRLVRLMDKVVKLLEREDYPYFLLDGQTVMIEDYLEIKPEMKDKIYSLVKSGKLIAGPWYTIPDTFLPSGESLVANLETGIAKLKEMSAKNNNFAYTPDCFGMNSQFPQIFKQFGMEALMYTRGQRLEPERGRTTETYWTSPDGTVMPAIYDDYCMGCFMTVPTVWRNHDRIVTDGKTAVSEMKTLLNYQKGVSCCNTKFCICGVDHLEPKENLTELIKVLNSSFDDTEFILSSMTNYFNELKEEIKEKNLPQAFGEQRGPFKNHYLLGNTLSSRMDIKNISRKTEDLLENVIQPLSFFLPEDNSFNALDTEAVKLTVQKELLKCHPHDSICTCSSDKTSSQVKQRLEDALLMEYQIIKNETGRLGSMVKGNGCAAIVVYNPMPYKRSGVLEGRLAVPYDLGSFTLKEENGNTVGGAEIKLLFKKRNDIETMKFTSFEMLECDTTRSAMLVKGDGHDILTGISYKFFAEDVPPLGYKCVYLCGGEPETVCDIKKGGNFIDNGLIRLEFKEGKINLYDKNSGITVKDFHSYEDCGDFGDTYTFSPVTGDKLCISGKSGAVLKEIKSDSNDAHIITETVLSVYANMESRIKDGEKNNVTILTDYKINRGSDIAEIETEIINNSGDHRLSAVIKGDNGLDHAFSDTAFALTKRPVYDVSELKLENIMTMPMRDLLLIPCRDYSLAVFTSSAREYECVKDKGIVKAKLTLIRAVGRGYSTKTLTKNEICFGEGIRWFTPDAQMTGSIKLRYGVKIYPQDTCGNALLNCAKGFSNPLLAYGAYPEGTQPCEKSFLSVEGAVLSCCGTDRQGKKFARLYNADEKTSRVKIITQEIYSGAKLCGLKGDTLNVFKMDKGCLEFELEKSRIATLFFET